MKSKADRYRLAGTVQIVVATVDLAVVFLLHPPFVPAVIAAFAAGAVFISGINDLREAKEMAKGKR